MRHSIRVISLLIVIILLLSSVVMSFQMEKGDAGGVKPRGYLDVPSGPDYGYIIEYNAANTEIINVSASVGRGEFSNYNRVATDSGYTLNSFWTFNSQGLGPFNTFYAAINITTQQYIDDHCAEDRISHYAGNIAYILAPNNLSTTINGNTFDTSFYNIVLVIPTVYWYSDPTNNKLYMSNVKDYFNDNAVNNELKAYAHTFYDSSKQEEFTTSHIGLGVYLSSSVTGADVGSTGDVKQYMVSQPGLNPDGGKKVDTYNEYTQNLEDLGGYERMSEYQVSNYYQWTLYKMMAYTIMGTKNSQLMFGRSNQNPYASIDYTGDPTAFPYRGGENLVSLLIQNPYGATKWEGLGDVYMSSEQKLYIGNTLSPGKLGTSAHVLEVDLSGLVSGWISKTSKESATWDLPIESSSTEGKTINDIGDYVKGGKNTMTAVYTSGDGWSQGGLANVVFDTAANSSAHYHKSRLVVIFHTEDAEITFKPGYDTTQPDYKQTFQKGVIQYLKPNQFAPPTTDMKFAGWSYVGTGGTTIVQDGARIAIANDQVFTATWAQYIFNVTFDSDGGTPVPIQKVAENGYATDPANTLPVTKPTKAGYILEGWYIGDTKFDFATTKITDNVALKAKWAEAVTVTFDSNGGSRVDDMVIKKGTSLPMIPSPTRPGYFFADWYVDKDQQTKFTHDQSLNEDTRLYAKWNATTTAYTVTFDTRVVGLNIATQTVNSGELAVQPERLTRANYSFVGWFLNDRMYTFTEPVTENITLKAKWDEWAFLIKFDANGGTCIAGDMQVGTTLSKKVYLPTSSEAWYSEHTFRGWCTDLSGTPVTYIGGDNP